MGTDTKIEWADDTINTWWGCDKIDNNPGCDMCYAERESKRHGHDVWGAHAPRKYVKSWKATLDKAHRLATVSGCKRRVFVGSMMDIFERSRTMVDWHGNRMTLETGHVRAEFLSTVDAYKDTLIFLLLTKRPSNIVRFVPERWLTNWPEHVWTGYSAADQASLEMGIDTLVEVPGKHFLSLEPLLGPINLDNWLPGISWVICGGESGPRARPTHPNWIRNILAQCRRAGVMFHVKQWGEWLPRGQQFANGAYNHPADGVIHDKVGKKAAGRTLDGVEYNEVPA